MEDHPKIIANDRMILSNREFFGSFLGENPWGGGEARRERLGAGRMPWGGTPTGNPWGVTPTGNPRVTPAGNPRVTPAGECLGDHDVCS